MFWSWMIDPGKKILVRQHITTSPGNLTERPQVEPFLFVQEEVLGSEAGARTRDFTLLLRRGFTVEEIHVLCKLQEWYQNGGSDRALILYHLEFLKRLVASGILEQ